MDPGHSYSADELFKAAAALIGMKARRASKQLSRQTDKSYVVVGKDGEIIARLRIADVCAKCKYHATSTREAIGKSFISLQSRSVRILVFSVSAAVLASLFFAGSNFFAEQSLKEEQALNRKILGKIADSTKEFMESLEVARLTPRISLFSAISKLQELKSDLESVENSACLHGPLQRILNGQSESIKALVYFMDTSSSSYVTTEMLNSGLTEMSEGLKSSIECTSLEHLRKIKAQR